MCEALAFIFAELLKWISQVDANPLMHVIAVSNICCLHWVSHALFFSTQSTTTPTYIGKYKLPLLHCK